MTQRRITIAIAALVGLVILTAVFIHRFAGRNSLAGYKAELRAKGELLTLAELPPPTFTNGNPKLTALTNAVAALRSTGRWRDREMMQFIKPGVARSAWMTNPTDDKETVNEWAVLAQNLQDNAGQLETIRASLVKPESDTGWSRTNIFDVPRTFISRRTAAQWLSRATLSALRKNEFSLALENLHSQFGLVQVQKDDLLLVNQMIRVAIAGQTFATTWEALQCSGWNDEQLARLQEDVASLDLIDAIEKGTFGERILGLEYFQWARANKQLRRLSGPSASVLKVQDQIKGNLWSATLAEGDELSFLQASQRHVEHVRLLRQGKTGSEVIALLDADMKHIQNLADSYQSYLQPITMITIPNLRRAVQKAVQVETQRQMLLGVVALKRYQLRHGKPVADLTALVPEFLSELPRDWMNQNPLKYRVTENGFVLYSVGDDGRDDGGDPTPTKPLGKDKFEIWLGRDAVWPNAEPSTAE